MLRQEERIKALEADVLRHAHVSQAEDRSGSLLRLLKALGTKKHVMLDMLQPADVQALAGTNSWLRKQMTMGMYGTKQLVRVVEERCEKQVECLKKSAGRSCE